MVIQDPAAAAEPVAPHSHLLLPAAPNTTWLDILQALSVPILAAFGIWIAYRQWRVAWDNRKLNLYNRRYEVYSGLREFLLDFFREGESDARAISTFIFKTGQATFLFGSEIPDYLQLVLDKVMEHDNALIALRTNEDEKERARLSKEAGDLNYWILNQPNSCIEKFSPYLRFED